MYEEICTFKQTLYDNLAETSLVANYNTDEFILHTNYKRKNSEVLSDTDNIQCFNSEFKAKTQFIKECRKLLAQSQKEA
jgi:hypothetical protein